MFTKVCGLRNTEQIDWAIKLGYSAIGVVLYPGSPRYCDKKTAVIKQDVEHIKEDISEIKAIQTKMEKKLITAEDMKKIVKEALKESGP